MAGHIQSEIQGRSEDFYGVGDKIPNALSPGQLMQVLNMRKSVFYLAQRRGDFKVLELPSPIGAKRYSGRLVLAYLQTRG